MKLRQRWDWIKASPVRLTVFVVVIALVIVALIPTVITWAPHWLASTNGLNASQRADEVGRVRTALLAVLAGAVAVIGAIYTGRTFGLNRQGQITERFTRAVDQLGSEKLDVRLGGIYALERLARESRRDHGPIMEILTAYVREHAPQPTRAEGTPDDVRKDPTAGQTSADARANEATAVSNSPATDVQAVLTVLGRRTTGYDTASLDLRHALLAWANLDDTDLQEARLDEANLQRASLERANLQGANFGRANLQRASVTLANLQGAHLYGTKLQRARLDAANLQGAFLDEANLQGALLDRANLQGARLYGTNLQGASLDGATLWGARYDRDTSWGEFNPSAHGAVPLAGGGAFPREFVP